MDFRGVAFLIISVTMVAVMSHIRKKYRIRHGDAIPLAASFLLYGCLLSTVLGIFFTVVFSAGEIGFDGASVGLAAVYALCSTTTAMIFIVATAWGNLSVLTMVAMLGSLVIPPLYGAIAFPEENRITLIKAIGFLLALVCMALIFQKKPDGKRNRKFLAACIIAFFTQGSALVIFDTECRYCPETPYFLFVSAYMLISAGAAFAVVLLLTKKKNGLRKEAFAVICEKNTAFLIGAYGILFCVSEVLALKSVERLPLIVQAPLSFGFQIVIVAVIDYWIYREKLSALNIVQIILAIATCFCFCV